MGGYRTFDTISPRTQYLITERLGLTLGCYDPISCLGKVIVDAEGNRIAYVTFMEVMLEEIQEAGVRFFFGHAMTSMARDGENYNVYMANLPFPVAAQRVILTMPQYPLQMVRATAPLVCHLMSRAKPLLCPATPLTSLPFLPASPRSCATRPPSA